METAEPRQNYLAHNDSEFHSSFEILATTNAKMPTVYLLDYVAGNVRSLANAIEKLGFDIKWVTTPADVASADVRSTEKA